MSAFEARVNIGHLGASAIKQNPEDPDEKALQAELSFGIVNFLPANGQFIPIPFGIIHTAVDKITLDNYIIELQTVSEQMREPSKIEVANDLSSAEKIAQVQNDLKG